MDSKALPGRRQAGSPFTPHIRLVTRRIAVELAADLDAGLCRLSAPRSEPRPGWAADTDHDREQFAVLLRLSNYSVGMSGPGGLSVWPGLFVAAGRG